MIAIGKDLRLQRQEGAPRVDQVNARQSVLERDFLRADVLSYCQRIVGAPLTVASLATISTSRPDTRPIPVTMPALGASWS